MIGMIWMIGVIGMIGVLGCRLKADGSWLMGDELISC
jgi:hypothetical protein